MVCPLCVLFLRRDGEKTASRWSFFRDATQEKFRHGGLASPRMRSARSVLGA